MGRGYQRVPQEPKLQPYLWYLLRGLQGYWLRRQQINTLSFHFSNHIKNYTTRFWISLTSLLCLSQNHYL